jgi:hypothetical protein
MCLCPLKRMNRCQALLHSFRHKFPNTIAEVCAVPGAPAAPPDLGGGPAPSPGASGAAQRRVPGGSVGGVPPAGGVHRRPCAWPGLWGRLLFPWVRVCTDGPPDAIVERHSPGSGVQFPCVAWQPHLKAEVLGGPLGDAHLPFLSASVVGCPVPARAPAAGTGGAPVEATVADRDATEEEEEEAGVAVVRAA